MKADRSFDGLAEKFAERITDSSKGQLRDQMLWWHMQASLPALANKTGSRVLNVLDAGGGFAQMSIRLAHLGHHIVLNDLSTDMLDIAKDKICEAGNFAGQIQLFHGPIQTLLETADKKFDLIICHALLEWLVDPQAVLQALAKKLSPGGYLSLAFYNRHALALNNAIKGNINYLLPNVQAKKPKRKGLSPPNAQFPEDVFLWLENFGLEEQSLCGIRVMMDWIPAEDINKASFDELLAIEKHYCQRLPYLLNGRYIHGIYRQPR